jgi:hypothetical protein
MPGSPFYNGFLHHRDGIAIFGSFFARSSRLFPTLQVPVATGCAHSAGAMEVLPAVIVGSLA